MPKIQQLSHSVVTKIAAGEVIERPASVVKELLENSVDAGAGRIELELEQGGVERITVVDDGCGMSADDLPLAFASHATSKLREADDLFRIGTLGFRGEALASISGVAHVRIQSRPPSDYCGSEMHCHGGSQSAVKPWNGAPGTRIEVRHLFYNTPVRKKFLRSTATEMGHVCETFTRLALAYPTLHLKLSHNNKLVYEVPASAGLLDRVGLFFGADVRKQLLDVEASQGAVTLSGFVADPACDRGTAKMQYLFVNGRWVRDRSLGHAAQEAYRGLLMVGRHPVTFLFLDLPPDAVDVNVHPTKCEVRFRDGQQLYHLVRSAVRQRLSAANLVPRLQPTKSAEPPPLAEPQTAFAPWNLPAPPAAPAPVASAPLPPPPAIGPVHTPTAPSPPPPTRPAEPPASQTPASMRPRPAPSLLPGVPDLRALQIHDTYLVVETPDGVLLIDQHALHERILFEQLKRRMLAGTLERQRLLLPEPVDLTAEQAARTLEARDALAELGLEVEDFGGGTVLLSSYPALLGRVPAGAILRSAVDFLVGKDRPPTRHQLLNDLLATMACKAAVKAGDRLSADEIAALLAQRQLADDTHHCPHGRPTALLFSRHDLERQFGRI